MDRRTKILTALFSVLIGYAVVSGVVYPKWIKPQITIDERIAEREKELHKLEAAEKAAEAAKQDYRAFVERIGSFDVTRVENELRARLNKMIERHGLQNSNVTSGRESRDPKTDVKTLFVTVTATSTLEGAVKFLKDLSELPQLVRITSPKLDPASSSRKDAREPEKDRVNLTVPIEVMVLPPERMVGSIPTDTMVQPITVVRHSGRDYSRIWDRKPFQDYVKLLPLRAIVRKEVSVQLGQPAVLQASATGGDGNYTYKWSPSEGLLNDSVANPTADGTSPGSRNYSVTITDGRGSSVSESVTVTVREPVVVAPPPQVVPPPVVPTGPPPAAAWADGRFMQLCMASGTRTGDAWDRELVVYNNKTKSSDYYKIGAAFDGGTLLFVHHRGAVGRRNEDYFVYPIGATLDQALREQDAAEFPELQQAVLKIKSEQQKPQQTEHQPSAMREPAPESRTVDKTDSSEEKVEVMGPPADLVSTRSSPANRGVKTIPLSEALPAGPPEPANAGKDGNGIVGPPYPPQPAATPPQRPKRTPRKSPEATGANAPSNDANRPKGTIPTTPNRPGGE